MSQRRCAKVGSRQTLSSLSSCSHVPTKVHAVSECGTQGCHVREGEGRGDTRDMLSPDSNYQTSGKDTTSDFTSSIDDCAYRSHAHHARLQGNQQSTLPSPATACPSPLSPSIPTARLSPPPPPSIPTPRLHTTHPRHRPSSPLATIIAE